MRWQGRRQSENVEDRRGMPGGPLIIGGGLGTLVLIVIVLLLGGDPQAVLQQLPQQQQQPMPGGAGQELTPEQKQLGDFAKTVLASTEDVWREIFRQSGKTYREPTLVMFTGRVESACGLASAAVGPFYCPADQKLYIDLGFYEQLERQFGAPGDFAQAYVLAHEVGHHVQNLLGYSDLVQSRRGRISREDYNALSVRLELQADYLAGVWAHHSVKRDPGFIEPGDLEEGLRAAAAIGDDTLQRQTQGFAVPDSFTHGTSEQRVRWLREGLRTGDLSQLEMFFEADEL